MNISKENRTLVIKAGIGIFAGLLFSFLQLPGWLIGMIVALGIGPASAVIEAQLNSTLEKSESARTRVDTLGEETKNTENNENNNGANTRDQK